MVVLGGSAGCSGVCSGRCSAGRYTFGIIKY